MEHVPVGGGIFLLLALLAFIPAARAANVQFTFTYATGQINTNVNCTLTPTGLTTNGVGIVDLSPLTATVTSTNSIYDSFGDYIGTNGTFTFSNIAPGTYFVRNNSTFFSILVTNYAGTEIATNLITGLTLPGVNAVYTRGQADGRFLMVTNFSVPNGWVLVSVGSNWIAAPMPSLLTNAFFESSNASPALTIGPGTNVSLMLTNDGGGTNFAVDTNGNGLFGGMVSGAGFANLSTNYTASNGIGFYASSSSAAPTFTATNGSVCVNIAGAMYRRTNNAWVQLP